MKQENIRKKSWRQWNVKKKSCLSISRHKKIKGMEGGRKKKRKHLGKDKKKGVRDISYKSEEFHL